MKNGSFLSLLLLAVLCFSSEATDKKIHTRLYQEIATTNANHNLIFSPFSIQLCLALAHLGASGATADEIAQVIGYSSNFNINYLTELLGRFDEFSLLEVANKVYVKSGYELKPQYETSVRNDLKSDVETLDFSQQASAARTINDWIERKTHDRIKNVIKPQMLDEAIRMVLINAVYFKGNWFRKFYDSKPAQFTNEDGSVSTVPMMNNDDHYYVGRVASLSANIVKLKYFKEHHNTKTSMYVVIPDAVDGLTKIERNLEKLNFKDLNERMQHKYIEFYMPKFTFETEIKLVDVLKNLGMTKSFTNEADFSNMLKSKERLLISDAIHKAFIKVDEKGTEAAAVTVMFPMAVAAFRVEQVLKADRPFLFAIVHDDYEIPLFMGAVKNFPK